MADKYTDPETGLIYLRARYYDPATAQFLTRDPLDAITRSAYGYVDGNPLNGSDPTGLCSVLSTLNPFSKQNCLRQWAYDHPTAGMATAVTAGVAAALVGVAACVAGGCEAAAAWFGATSFGAWLSNLFSGEGAAACPQQLLEPGGNPIGAAGSSPTIRVLSGGAQAAQDLFDSLSAGGTDVTPPNYPGKLVQLANNAGTVGLRLVSGSGDPAIDVNIPGVGITKIHFGT